MLRLHGLSWADTCTLWAGTEGHVSCALDGMTRIAKRCAKPLVDAGRRAAWRAAREKLLMHMHMD